MDRQDKRAYQVALAAGIMPADAEDALQDAAQVEQRLPTEAEMAEDAIVTEADIARSHQWWLLNPHVPAEFRRLLMAEERRAD